jgi:photosynthetic reaction center cytochrome c subunit
LQLNLPAVEQVLERYVTALGGAAAIQRITSRVEKGSVAGSGARVEIFSLAPGKWEMMQSTANGSSVAVFDGKNGWFAVPGQPVHDMHPGDLDAARMDGDLQFALHVRDFFPDLRVEYPEKVDGRTANVLVGAKDGWLAAKFYFDAESGLLLRVIRYADSPLGMNPSQVEYADYREVDGVKVAFRVTRVQPGSRVEILLEEVKQNGEIAAGRFGKPGK